MSHDLFSAFGGESTPTATKIEYTYPVPGDDLQQIWSWDEAPEYAKQHTTESTRRQQDEPPFPPPDDGDDDFGDFEDASAPVVVHDVPQTTTNVELHGESKPPAVSQVAKHPVPSKPIQPARSEPPSSKAAQTPKSASQHPFAGHMDLLFEAGDDEYDAGADELTDLSNNPEAAMAYSKRIIAEQEQSRSTTRPQPTAHRPPSESVKPAPSNKLQKNSDYAPQTRNADVLFDAENVSEHEDDADDFGDFEDWNDTSSSAKGVSSTTQSQTPTPIPAIDLLGLDDTSGSSSNAQPSQSQYRAQPPRTTRVEPQFQTNEVEDDVWDDFETTPPQPQSPRAAATSSPANPLHPTQPTQTTNAPQSSLPPINIPPPTLLLTLFPPLFSSADSALFDTLSKLDLKQRQALLAHPASHQFLRGYIAHSVVLAHIIAGRKLRWKRDTRLSQSMRIGPSNASGGKGGMKLAGLDKAELAKEDREVLDVLRLWKVQVGKLRTAVTAASAAPGLPKLPSVPDLAEQMPVKTLKQAEGGVTAPHACALCGLRREERVARVDVEVEDSFGEWWVQGMNMHVGCRKFWEEFERKLKSR